MYLKSNRAGVIVERIGSKRQHKYKLTEKSITMVSAGTLVIPVHFLSNNFQLYNQNCDELIQPEGNFWITAETIDPYHVVIDMF
jgi:hypothetical protein